MSSVATRVAARTFRLMPRKRLSRTIGRLASQRRRSAFLARAIGVYVKSYKVDLSEAQVPAGGFRTFDSFFTRELKPGQRPLCEGERVLSCPSDGRFEDSGPICEGASLTVKGRPYTVSELLGDEEDAQRFEGGHFALIYLSPRDYHRVHAPVGGVVEKVRHIGGTLLPVNSFGVSQYPKLFAENERVAVFQRSPLHGEVVTILVGAIGVGRISVSFDPEIMTNVGRTPTTHRYDEASAPTLERGDELGIFHLGSTAIVLTTPGAISTFEPEAGGTVRMGTPLAMAPPT